MGDIRVVPVIATIVAWLAIILVIYWRYKKVKEETKRWKVLLIVLIGMFSLSFNWDFHGTVLRLPVVPLGVFILMIIFKVKRAPWQFYRSFAWLGFFSLFCFIITTLLTIPINQALYPEDELSTYVADVEHASIIQTHPSAEERSLNRDALKSLEMERDTIYSEIWYQQADSDMESREVDERFPYLLTGVQPKWGSGAEALIYVEEDGKGLLLTTLENQYYFRSEDALIEEGAND
ncbi:hypothetical protein SAMN05216389_101176 [Oceanobacillus limi]|uniref:Uncharacterized protein n=1 Tax=Oceanobacillus limi TaxID=930131 RepID=A0A1H9Y564_9BACI|nr:hypothetical protein [Oceanobacillus limi]SES63520.1 hypothetical protein SAMN05216389_101176 [Oceanobacillus limi]